jgi:predicted nucleotidyltransferase
LAALADLPDIAARLSRALTEAGVPHAISGALAMAAHGYVRATRDIDILVATSAIRWPEVFRIVRDHGFEGEETDLIAALRERSVAALTSGPATVEILVPVLPYHNTLVSRAVTIEVLGVPVPFVSPEDLVVLKALWHRTKDVADIKALLTATGLDRGYIRETLAGILGDRLDTMSELRQILDLLG